MAIEFDFEKQPGRSNRKGKGAPVRYGAEEPLISIITAFYNDGSFLRQTCQSVLDQTFPWFEWIIVDDGSDDEGSITVLKEISAFDQRIKTIRGEHKGIASARNLGIKNAKAGLIQILDADDLIEPTYLEYCYWMLLKNPEAAWACTAFCVFGREEYLVDIPFDGKKELNENLLLPEALIRKEWLEKAGSYPEIRKDYYEDWALWLRLMAAGGFPVQSRGETLCWYRRRKGGVLDRINKDAVLKQDSLDIIKEIKKDVYSPAEGVMFPGEEPKGMSFHGPVRSDFSRKKYNDDNKTNVLFILHWFSRGGADKFNIDLTGGLDRSLFNVSVVTTLKGDNEWLQRARGACDEIFNLPNFMDIVDFPEFVSYLIRSRSIDIVFIDISTTGYYMLPWLKATHPDIIVLDYIHMVERFWRGGGCARLSGVMAPFIDHTYVCNTVTAGELVRDFGLEEEKVTTVHIGIDQHYYDRRRLRKGILREKLFIEKSRPVILFPCRICPQKRPFLMLKIAERVCRDRPEAVFVVVGDGADLDRMKGYVKTHQLSDNVLFAGAAEEVRPYYMDADLTLICSLSEGLTLTAYESLSMGVPVISADVGGQRDLIDDEVGALIPLLQDETKDYNARFFPEEEIRLYVKAIEDYLDDKDRREAASESCRKRIEEGFTTEKMVAFFNGELSRLKASLTGREQKKGEMFPALAEDIYTQHIFAEHIIHPDLAGKKAAKGLSEVITASSDRDIDQLVNMVNAHQQALRSHEEVLNRHEEVVNRHEEVVNRHEEVVNRHEEVVNRHEEVVNRHEEVVNRHEEVVNRHEGSLNHQWDIQKWHEERIQTLEKKKYFCPCCGNRTDRFIEGSFRQNIREVDTARYEKLPQDVICPVCYSLPRHRILVSWMEKHIELFREKRILHFALEDCMKKWYERKGIYAASADLYAEAECRMDIQDTGLESGSEDAIICNHVLEHVENYSRALSELRRILRPEGICILSFPIDKGFGTVYEDAAKTTEEARRTAFGQTDHLRIFGRDSRKLLEKNGFAVELIRGSRMKREIKPVVGPADYDSNILFLCRKK